MHSLQARGRIGVGRGPYNGPVFHDLALPQARLGPLGGRHARQEPVQDQAHDAQKPYRHSRQRLHRRRSKHSQQDLEVECQSYPPIRFRMHCKRLSSQNLEALQEAQQSDPGCFLYCQPSFSLVLPLKHSEERLSQGQRSFLWKRPEHFPKKGHRQL